ncbi:hypothetical protein [Spiroplasma mirum]|nr:hypothetical protein [Spiroplasma mirum]
MFTQIIDIKKEFSITIPQTEDNSFNEDHENGYDVINITGNQEARYEFSLPHTEDKTSQLLWTFYYAYKNYYLKKLITCQDYILDCENILLNDFKDLLFTVDQVIYLAPIIANSMNNGQVFNWEANIRNVSDCSLAIIISTGSNSVVGYYTVYNS